MRRMPCCGPRERKRSSMSTLSSKHRPGRTTALPTISATSCSLPEPSKLSGRKWEGGPHRERTARGRETDRRRAAGLALRSPQQLGDARATWQEHWFDHRQLLRLYDSDEHCADPDVRRAEVRWLPRFISVTWQYSKAAY